MNSEELEQSLRTEFESYLKNVLADMRQEVSEFQKKFEAEFEKHKSQLDELFQNFSGRITAEKSMETGFTESVVEHLRLARDEGARITAMAIAEAEEMEKEKAAAAAPKAGISEIRNAINDISSKNTQSTILKSLVNQAEQFTPRGAFFIIKNEQLVGWRVFGEEGAVDEQIVREVFFPVSADTVLGEAVRSLTTVESSAGTFSGDAVYLDKLEFGHPDKMLAIPLVVRGRAVALLYADQGNRGGEVNLEALETLVRVASLTVEVLASSRGAQTQAEPASVAVPVQEPAENYQNYEEKAEAPAESVDHFQAPAEETPAAVEEVAEEVAEEAVPEYEYQVVAQNEEGFHESDQSSEQIYTATPLEKTDETFVDSGYQTMVESDGFAFQPSSSTETAPETVSDAASYSYEEAPVEMTSAVAEEEVQASVEEGQTVAPVPSWNQPVVAEDYSSQTVADEYETPAYQVSEAQSYEATPVEAQAPVAQSEYDASPSGNYEVESNQPYEASPVQFEENPQTYEAPQYETPNYAPVNGQTYGSYTTENGKTESYSVPVAVETVNEPVVAPPSRSRFSDRNMDLPIDVSEEERRLHTDARRFARLLVSEIKLYNEQKVKEGREANDLYDRLREAIDRSREMYDKRVQPPVAAKFDYFHYELVNNLAEGDADKLGSSYPGAAV